MGCACFKPKTPSDDVVVATTDELKGKSFSRPQTRHFNGSARIETLEVLNGIVTDKDRERSKSRRHNGREDSMDKRKDRISEPNPRLGIVPKQIEAEQVAAGWPAWLSAVAGEAIRGWVPRKPYSYKKLDKIGQGTYSNVYRAEDLDNNNKLVALKKVRFDNLEPESVKFMAREIQILRRLDHPNVVKLEGLVTSRMSSSLYLVFEYMEHDLAGLAASPGISFTEAQVKCYLQQLLRGLEHCHTRSVLHRDIKGSNLLIGDDGILKIADFGLATFYRPDQRIPLTSRVVTLWYRPPELLLGATDYNIGVDLWSTGCILAELLAGKPIMPGRTEVEQLHKIFKLCGSPSEDYWRKSKLPHATIFKPQQPYKRCIAEVYKDFPATALALLETLLAIEPADRLDSTTALKSDFFTTKPFPCDPSALPKYPPSKEFDAKMRDEEARRQRAARHGPDGRRQGSRERGSRAAPDANAELQVSLQKRRLQSHSSKSKSEKFHSLSDKTASGFPIEPPPSKHAQQATEVVRGTSPVLSRQFVPPASSRSGPMMNPAAWAKKQQEELRMAPPRPIARTARSNVEVQSQNRHWATTTGGDSAYYSKSSRIDARQYGETDARNTDEEFPRHLRNTMKQAGESRKLNRDDQMDSRRSDVFRGPPTELSNIPEMSNGRDSGLGYDERMYHSGPLLRPGSAGAVDIEELLEVHERKLKQAVKRAGHENSTTTTMSDKKDDPR